MGNNGRLSRILCLYLGSPYTYASLGKPIASGQFSVDEVKKIIRLKMN
jgi:3-dehydroquinate dehydratase-1